MALARVPASTSNLGPGFDVLGLALALYVEVEVTSADQLIIESSGEGAELARDATHLAAKIATKIAGTDRLRIRVSSEIPLGRGLGSSAALVAATAAAAGAADPLQVAAHFDGHAENAAASCLDGEVVAKRLPLDPSLIYVALIPDRELATKTARGVLANEVPFSDAVFNLGRLGLLLAGLANGAALVKEAGEDRLHQAARVPLYPEAPALLQALRDAGAVISCWSGAGPTLFAICRDRATATRVAERGTEALAESGLTGRAVVLEPDLEGLRLSS